MREDYVFITLDDGMTLDELLSDYNDNYKDCE
jgi:hypothetical protein